MVGKNLVQGFIEGASRVGATVTHCTTLAAAADYVARTAVGRTLVPQTALAEKFSCSHCWKRLEWRFSPVVSVTLVSCPEPG